MHSQCGTCHQTKSTFFNDCNLRLRPQKLKLKDKGFAGVIIRSTIVYFYMDILGNSHAKKNGIGTILFSCRAHFLEFEEIDRNITFSINVQSECTLKLSMEVNTI